MNVPLGQRRAPALLAPEATPAEVVHWAVAHAILAPSELNSQPWSFRACVDGDIGAARIELGLDRTRLLTHVDPAGREAVLACGAALLNLRLALRGAELGSSVQLCPDPALHDLLAVLNVRGRTRERAEDRPLREAIPQRGTRRAPFEPGEIPVTLLNHLIAEAAYEGALVSMLDRDDVSALRAIDEQACDRCVLVVGSVSDDRASLLRAGAGLERVLLAATAAGVSCRLVNTSLQRQDSRSAVGRLAGLDHPQAVLHLGYGDPDTMTPRRPVEDVLVLLDASPVPAAAAC